MMNFATLGQKIDEFLIYNSFVINFCDTVG